MKVLIVEDNLRLANAIVEGLRDAGYFTSHSANGNDALELVQEENFDAIVLDIMLNGLDGISVLRRLRRRRMDVPVLILTARDTVEDRVNGLDAGADDYLVKPFAFDELLARLRAIMRRHSGSSANVISIGELEVDTLGKTAKWGNTTLTLSAREYSVLELLAQRRGRIVTRNQLIGALYGPGDEPASNVVDVFVAQLRRKLQAHGASKLVQTRRGLGYVLDIEE